MGNINLLTEDASEKARKIYSLMFDDAELKIKKLKDSNVIEEIWKIASGRDDSKFKAILKSRAKELNINLVG